MKLEVEKVAAEDQDRLKKVYAIRKQVFVVEQKVPAEAEYDEFEENSTHFLATLDDEPVGAARWRYTEKGVKLERFAVLKEVRGQGVGQSMVKAVLLDIQSDPKSKGKMKYLNAQLDAVPLYAKFKFKKVGDVFEECNILHYQMQLA